MSSHSSHSQSRKSAAARRTKSPKRNLMQMVGLEPLELRSLLSGSVLATVINDLNASKTNDAGDVPLQGWTVFVDTDRSGTLDAGEPSQLTDANGQATFTNIANGKADIREILPAGWSTSIPSTEVQRVNINNDQTTNVLFLNTQATPVGTITGAVWNDINGDGIRAATDPGIPGWKVFVDLNTNRIPDVGEPFAITDANGVYTITNLATGRYKVRDVTPPGWDATLGFDGQNNVDVVAGHTSKSDFGNFNTPAVGVVQGSVWNDVNADGSRAAGDAGLGGWTVFLDANNNGSLDPGESSAVTDPTGVYSFPSVNVGTYKVTEILQDGWNLSRGHPLSQPVTVISEGVSRVEFANFTPTLGSLSGTVFNDINGDGIRTDEPALPGWTVFIDQNSDGIANPGEPTAVTDDTGAYSFTDLPIGSILVREIPQVGWSPTAPGTGVQLVTIQNASNINNINFGNKQRTDGAISGTVFFDANQNGVKDPTEKTLPGITVYLDTNNNGTLDPTEQSTVSSPDLFYTPAVDESGTYSFTHLPTGTFHVREIIPAVLSSTPLANQQITVDLLPGEDRHNVNFADRFRPNEIHGLVYDDANQNHARDAGEAGIPGVTVYLDLNRDNVYQSTEPRTVTGADGTYSFLTDLKPGAYVVRELRQSGREHSYPTTTGGILWPSGVSNPAVGNVTPTSITTSLAEGQTEHDNVSITLPGSGALTNMVDVFLLFDDTGSFTANSPIVRAAFPQIISALQTAMPTVDFGFGVGRFEEYANFASELPTGRPFILNQPIVDQSTPGFSTSIQAALDRTAPGYGGDTPETDIEALFQMATGAGFDGNNNGTTSDSGAAGLVSTQLTPGASGDVPSFGSFTLDSTGNVLPAAGTIGGAGFRAGALPIILVATDTGFAFQPVPGETSITGANGLTLPISALTQTSRPTTPFNSGAGIQQTITALNALGAMVIGLGTNSTPTIDPRQDLQAIARLTGAINKSLTPIPNGTPTPINPGDPFYFQISSGFGPSVANGVVAAIENGISNVAVNITVKASDPSVDILSAPGVVNGVGAGQTASFDVTFTGDSRPHRFDLQFVREGTNVVLGSIPVVIGTPIAGDGYEYEDLHDGDISHLDDFGSYVNPLLPINNAPTYTKGSDQTTVEGANPIPIPAWATTITTGAASESDQLVDFDVTADNYALFSSQPTISPDGTLTYTVAPGAIGTATVTVKLHDTGGTVNGGSDTSPVQTFTITVPPPAPITVTPHLDTTSGEAILIDFSADVTSSLSAQDLQLTNLTTNQPATLPFTYDPIQHRATIALKPNTLPNGDYRLTIPAGAVTGQATPQQFDFFILAGDVNRDRAVNFADLVTVAQNYGSTTATHAQGDLTGDAQVSFADLVLLAQNYGTTLAPLASPVSAAPALASLLSSPPATHTATKPVTPIKRVPAKVTTKLVITARPTPPSAFSKTRIKHNDTVWN